MKTETEEQSTEEQSTGESNDVPESPAANTVSSETDVAAPEQVSQGDGEKVVTEAAERGEHSDTTEAAGGTGDAETADEVSEFVDAWEQVAEEIETSSGSNLPAGGERRGTERFKYARDITGQLLDREYWPIGEQFKVHACNLSTAGIAVGLKQRVAAGSIIGLQMGRTGGTVIKVAVEVVRCDSREDGFEIAGRFITRLR